MTEQVFDGRLFEEEVRNWVERYLREDEFEGPDFRWEEVRLIRGEPQLGARVAIIFHRDDEPGVRYGYWSYVWERAAWLEWAANRPNVVREPGLVAFEFVDYSDEVEDPAVRAEASPPDEEGIRWIRAVLVWPESSGLTAYHLKGSP